MDSRIADYIREHRSKLTREAITRQLVEAGHDRQSIEDTWTALDTPDPDDVAGEPFWGRWFLILIGINVAVILLVGLATGALFVPERIGLLGILAVALVIGALISWGLVAATGPAKMGRTTATVIGVAIPLVVALLLGGTCYALLRGMGPVPETGTLELTVEGSVELSGSGSATCYIYEGGAFSVFAQLDDRAYTTVDVSAYPPDGGPPTGDVATLMIQSDASDAPEQILGWSNHAGQARLASEVAGGGLSGTLTFTDLPSDLGAVPAEPDGPAPAPGAPVAADPISGEITWTCE
jgi:hypothetical protein